MNEIKRGGLRMSILGKFLDEKCMILLQSEKILYGNVIGHGVREFSFVIGRDHDYYADRVTGQLYADDLLCQSSTLLRLESVPIAKIEKLKRGGNYRNKIKTPHKLHGAPG